MTEKDRQDQFADDSPSGPGKIDPKSEDTGELGLSDEFLSEEVDNPLSAKSPEGSAPGWRDSFTQEFHGAADATSQPKPDDEPRDPFATGMIDSRELTEEAPPPSPDIWLDRDSTDSPVNDNVLHTGRISVPGEPLDDLESEDRPGGAFATQPYRIDEIFDRVATEASSVTDSKPTEEISSDQVAKTMMQFTQELPFNLRPERVKAQTVSPQTTHSSSEMPRSRAFSAGVVLGCVLLLVFFFTPWQTGWDIQEFVSANVTAGSAPPPSALGSKQIAHWAESGGELFFSANSYLWKYHPQHGFSRSNHLDPTLETALGQGTFRVISRPPLSAGYRVAYLAASTSGRGSILKFVDLNFADSSNPNQSGISREYSVFLAEDRPVTNYSAPVLAYTMGENPGPWIFVNESGTSLRVFTFDEQAFKDLGRLKLADGEASPVESSPHAPLIYQKLLSDGNAVETNLLIPIDEGLYGFTVPNSFDGDLNRLQPASKATSGGSAQIALAPFLGLEWDFVIGMGNRLEWIALSSERFETIREVTIPADSNAQMLGLLPANQPGELFAILDDSAWLIRSAQEKEPIHKLETQAFTNNLPDRANYMPLSAIVSSPLSPETIPQLIGIQGKGEFWIYDANHHSELVSGEWNVDVVSPVAWNLVDGRLRCDFASAAGTIYSYEFNLPATLTSPDSRLLPPPAQVMTRMARHSTGGIR